MTIQDIFYEILTLPTSYAEAKQQAEKVDRLFGFDIEQIEQRLLLNKKDLQKIHSNEARQFWIGLDSQSLQTPYSELVDMIQKLNPLATETWIDLGAAYGRIGLILGLLCPDVGFYGYEYIPERVLEGNRIREKWGIQNGGLYQADLISDKIDFEKGDVFFLYDFGSRSDVYKVLEILKQIASQKPIRVIARGRGVKNWIMMDFPWLGSVNEPKHYENWSLFQS